MIGYYIVIALVAWSNLSLVEAWDTFFTKARRPYAVSTRYELGENALTPCTHASKGLKLALGTFFICSMFTLPGKVLADPYESDPLTISNQVDGCVTESNPSTTTTFCRRVGLQKGRLRGCAATENCYSSSAKAAEKYLLPWSYGFKNTPIEDAWKELQIAIETQGLKILQAKPDSRYILAAEKGNSRQPQGSSNFYEFVIRPDDSLVLTRAFVDKTVFVYPLQQPVSDFGILQSKLNEIRSSLGWLTIE